MKRLNGETQMIFLKKLAAVSVASLLTLSVFTNVKAQEDTLTLFAAASTTNAIKDVINIYKSKEGKDIRTSFASSSTLAKQITNGAPADIYLSANSNWMDYLEQKGKIKKETRFDLLENRIALVVPSRSTIQKIDIGKALNIPSILGKDGRLAMGDPAHVPAGIYGKQALKKLGAWDEIKGKIAPMKDVRAALVMVERAETPLGIVYTTDAAVSEKVRIAGVFPSGTHPSIVYPVAIVSDGNYKAGTAFINFLKTPEAQSVFKKYGFKVK